jgi:hypothetical protein
MCQVIDIDRWLTAPPLPPLVTIEAELEAELAEPIATSLPGPPSPAAAIPPMRPHRPRRDFGWDGR